MSLVHSIYNKTIQKLQKHGTVGLGVLATIESIFFPIPVDTLLIVLCGMERKKSLFFAGIATLFSVFGAVIGYLIGAIFFDFAKNFLFYFINEAQFQSIFQSFGEHTFFVLFLSAFTFIPFKVFTLASGVAQVPFFPFLLGSLLGRSLRFFVIGLGFHFLNDRAIDFAKKTWPQITFALGLSLLLAWGVYLWI